MAETYMTYLYRKAGTRSEKIGESPEAMQSIEAARELGKTSNGIDGRRPDSFDIETDDGALKERWTWDGSDWSETYA